MGCKRFLVCVLLLLVSSVVTAQDGEVLMDIGFRAENDGFGFENYGNEGGVVNLTPVEMVRLFGEAVCSGAVDDAGGCKLTPSARMWMEETSDAMDGGHCEGLAVLSLLLYYGEIDVTEFDGDATPELPIEGNEFLQREVGIWWATQTTNPTYEGAVTGTPSEIVQALIDGMEDQLYTVGIYMPDGDGGHAITPYAVTDMGNDVYLIMVYDNNYPGEERFIEVNAAEETWVYTGSTNPAEPEAEYYGDAETQTLDLTPMVNRFEVQTCDFCGDAGTDEDEDFFSLGLNGRGALLVTDAEGRKSGVENGKLINEIPGAKVQRGKNGYSNARPPVIYLPAGTKFTASIMQDDGFGTPASSIILVRKGSVTVLNGITPGTQQDTLDIDGEKISYVSGEGSHTLTFRQGVSAQSGEDFLYEFSGSSGTLSYDFDPVSGQIQFDGDDGAAFDISIERVDAEGSSTDYHTEGWTMEGDGMGQFNPSEWGDTLEIEMLDAEGNVIGTESFENTPDEEGDNTGDEDADTGDEDTGDEEGNDSGNETGDEDAGNEEGDDTGDEDTGDEGEDTGDEDADTGDEDTDTGDEEGDNTGSDEEGDE